MKQKLMPLYDKIMLRKRNVIESVNDMLKNVAQIVHTRHRKKRNLLLSFALKSESSNKKSETCVKPRFKVGKRRHLAHGLPNVVRYQLRYFPILQCKVINIFRNGKTLHS